MAESPKANDVRSPTLDSAQIARLEPSGQRRRAKAGEVLFDQGDYKRGIFVVLSGAIEILNPDNTNSLVNFHSPGDFTGEVNVLAGRRSLVRGRASEDSELLEISRDNLLRVIQTDPELSEIFLRAFIDRRVRLISETNGDCMLIGSTHSPGTHRLREFLTRNGHPHSYIDVERDPGTQEILDHFKVKVTDIPILVCRGRKVLRNPTNAETAELLEFNAEIDESAVYDVVVVGAGPSGLAAAVYAASEGLNVLVLESVAPGGQAGSSSLIENYLGFPTGVSGQELSGRAFVQAQKFGAQIAIARSANGVKCGRVPFAVALTDGGSVAARSIIVATGAEYRRLPLANLKSFEGNGVYYAASNVEAQLCGDEEVVVVGGGNSAGQAAVFLSSRTKHVHVVVRGPALSDTMSRYLICRIEESPSITLHTKTEVTALDGDGCLHRVTLTSKETGQSETRDIKHLFSMTGACPNTAWLGECLALDDRRFIRTGIDLLPEHLSAARWPLRRPPLLFETSVPRVFAVGDVRTGSVKRVASAVGEGSIAVQLVHRVLGE